MTVKELITELKKCNPDDIVMYDAGNAVTNGPDIGEWHFPVDDVMIGSRTTKGFVYLSEELSLRA